LYVGENKQKIKEKKIQKDKKLKIILSITLESTLTS